MTPFTDNLEAATAFFDENPAINPGVDGHFNVIMDAARLYLQLAPLLEEMVEARKKATAGKWHYYRRKKTFGMVISVSDKENRKGEFIEVGGCDGNAPFIVSSANNTARIAEIIKGAE